MKGGPALIPAECIEEHKARKMKKEDGQSFHTTMCGVTFADSAFLRACVLGWAWRQGMRRECAWGRVTPHSSLFRKQNEIQMSNYLLNFCIFLI